MENKAGALIREWRKKRGWTQTRLAEETLEHATEQNGKVDSASVATIQRWESGKTVPHVKAFMEVLNLLNVPVKRA